MPRPRFMTSRMATSVPLVSAATRTAARVEPESRGGFSAMRGAAYSKRKPARGPKKRGSIAAERRRSCKVRHRRSPVSSHADVLAEVPLFSLLDDQERAALAERIDVVTMPAGKVVFSYGDPGDSMYVVRSGVVEISFANDTGDKIVLETARTGDFFGEISLLDGGARTAAARVIEDLEALVVDRGDLDELIRVKPQAAMDLLTATGKRLRETSRLLRHTASRNVNEDLEDRRTRVMKIADWISNFSGSLSFLFIHLAIFFVWIVLNVKPLDRTSLGGFDPYPFGLLTIAVSLE